MKRCINVQSKSWFVWCLWAGGLLDVAVLWILECPIIKSIHNFSLCTTLNLLIKLHQQSTQIHYYILLYHVSAFSKPFTFGLCTLYRLIKLHQRSTQIYFYILLSFF